MWDVYNRLRGCIRTLAQIGGSPRRCWTSSPFSTSSVPFSNSSVTFEVSSIPCAGSSVVFGGRVSDRSFILFLVLIAIGSVRESKIRPNQVSPISNSESYLFLEPVASIPSMERPDPTGWTAYRIEVGYLVSGQWTMRAIYYLPVGSNRTV